MFSLEKEYTNETRVIWFYRFIIIFDHNCPGTIHSVWIKKEHWVAYSMPRNDIFKLQWMIYLESKFHWNKWHLFYTDSSFSLQSTHYNEGKCFQTKNDLQLVQIHVAVIKKPILCIVLSKVYVSVRPLIIESTATNFSLFTNSQYFNIIVWTSSQFIRISSSSCVKKIMQSWKRYVL